MQSRTQILFVFISLAFISAASAQFDFFFSDKAFEEGAVNDVPALTLEIGDQKTLYIYYSLNGPSQSGIDAVAGVDIFVSNPGTIEWISGETLEYGVFISDTEIGRRWNPAGGGYGGGGSFGSGAANVDGSYSIGAFTIGGYAMTNDSTGPVFIDAGYDFEAEAFLFGKIDIRAIKSGVVQVYLQTGVLGIVNQGMSFAPDYGIANILVNPTLLLGDLNGDGLVTLLDVSLFVELLVNGGYQLEGDMNQDGEITLLDVDLFIEAIDHP